ncbi:MAG: hypothetical protein ABI200_04150, partial [Gaiellales bacterium]
MIETAAASFVPDWTFEPLEESLDAARLLTVSVADHSARAAWEPMARWAGIPKRRWRRHHPLAPGAALIALVDGRAAFDAAAWERFVSLVPGAIALPTRTAAAYGVSRASIRPPYRGQLRLIDLWRARRAARRLRRAERTLAAEVAIAGSRTQQQAAAALKPGDDGTPFAELPAYALGARFEQLLRWDDTSALVDLAGSNLTGRLLHLLIERGVAPGEALLTTAQLTSGVTVASPAWLAALPAHGEQLDDAQLAQWVEQFGWHALRALHLDAAPLRAHPEAIRSWHAGTRLQASSASSAAPLTAASFGIESNAVLEDVIVRARALTGLREQVSQHRIELHAALRAVTWTLADRLVRERRLRERDLIFDLTVDELLSIARGGAVPDLRPRQAAARGTLDARDAHDAAPPLADPPSAPTELELLGIPASSGIAQGPIVLLDEPSIDVQVDGAIIFCRVTDPGWM